LLVASWAVVSAPGTAGQRVLPASPSLRLAGLCSLPQRMATARQRLLKVQVAALPPIAAPMRASHASAVAPPRRSSRRASAARPRRRASH
jgi:hypothetical protein